MDTINQVEFKRKPVNASAEHLSEALEVAAWAAETPRNQWFDQLVKRNARRLAGEFDKRVNSRAGGSAQEFGRVMRSV